MSENSPSSLARNDQPLVNLYCAPAVTSALSGAGAAPAPDGALVTAGAQYRLTNGWSFLAKLDGELSATTNVYSGTGMIRKTW